MATPPPTELKLMLLRSKYRTAKSERQREILTIKANKLKKAMK